MDEDNQLIVRIAQADKQAISLLYAKYARLVYGTVLAIVKSPEEAEEVVVDVFAQVWRTASSYDRRKSKVTTWLITISRSRAIDRLRSLQRQTKIVTATSQAYPPPAEQHTPEANAIFAEQKQYIQQALSHLPTEQKQVVEMIYLQGLTHRETAQILSIPEGTVKTRLRLGIAKLKVILTDHHIDHKCP
jgi:RNA polymerase sigma-70 factor (ECF subfamily)